MEHYYQPEIECASREDILKLQNERLVKQVKHVYDNVPYYRKKMEEAGVSPEDIRSVEDLHKLPFITKDDLRDAYPYGLLAVPLKDCVRIQSTSGTTGRRVVAFYTQHDIDLWDDCCARAIMAAPELLFLDEPATGLDPRTAAEIHRLIRKEKERGTTVFLTTHNMEEAAKLCDHVALLNEGNIVEYGEPEEICRRYNHQHKIRIRFYNGECEELGSGAGEADRIAEYFRRGLVETIHSTEPDLETVFMELTGRRLL